MELVVVAVIKVEVISAVTDSALIFHPELVAVEDGFSLPCKDAVVTGSGRLLILLLDMITDVVVDTTVDRCVMLGDEGVF